MAEFKPMVKMMTTEPSVELKLKKGGKVEKKMAYGGMSGAGTMTGSGIGMAKGGMMPAKAPMKPSLNARRRAMAARPSGAAPAAPVGRAATMMKKGGKLDKEIRNESEEIGRVKAKLEKHEDMAASKAHKGLKTGGVVKGNGGGYKKGGMVEGDTKTYEDFSDKGNIIKTKTHKSTKVVQAKPDHSPAKTGGVKMGNAGGYATGGVVNGQGGYKAGGDVKKPRATGNVNDEGAPVAMPQGRKKPSGAVYITELAGTFKSGGKVTAAQGRLQKIFDKENAPAMKAAKKDSNEKYGPKVVKKAYGGSC